MSTTIKLKKSSVTGNSPNPANLEYGELALNYADGKLFFRKNDNTLSYFSTSGGAGGASDLDGLSDVVITNPANNEILKYNGTTWVNGTSDSVVGGVASYTSDLITASEGQTVFNSSYTVGYVDIYLNGVRLINNSDYTATNGTSITLTTAAVADDIVEVVKWDNYVNYSSYTKYSYTATSGQTVFSAIYFIGTVDVFLNGIRLRETTDYIANTGTQITLQYTAAENDVVEIIAWKNITAINGIHLLPDQTNNSGYILTTDGSTASWIPNSTAWTETSNNITATSGDKLFVDCSANAVTVTLPATPSMGDEIKIIDATGTAATYNITVARNGNNILGVAEDLVIQTDRAAFGLVYYNSAQGWVLMEK